MWRRSVQGTIVLIPEVAAGSSTTSVTHVRGSRIGERARAIVQAQAALLSTVDPTVSDDQVEVAVPVHVAERQRGRVVVAGRCAWRSHL
jgi:hypothetical protein